LAPSCRIGEFENFPRLEIKIRGSPGDYPITQHLARGRQFLGQFGLWLWLAIFAEISDFKRRFELCRKIFSVAESNKESYDFLGAVDFAVPASSPEVF